MAERVFNLPDLGEGLEDAEIVEWKVAAGDAVELNQPLVEVNTAKALVEIPSPVAGVVRQLHGEPGAVVAVGAPLVTFEIEGEAPTSGELEAAAKAGAEPKERHDGPPPDEAPRREALLVGYGVGGEGASRARRPRLRPPETGDAPAAEAEPGRVRASPVVRRLARERDVDLSSVRGTGPGGRVTREDVLKAGPGTMARPAAAPGAPSVAAGAEERMPVRGVRRLVAQKMARSWSEIPHVTTFHTVDATSIEALRRELSEESGAKISALAVIVRALAEVCRNHPKLNSSWDPDGAEIILKGSVHAGIAADTDRGLMVPVVRDAGDKGIVRLAGEIAEVVEAARSGRATPDQLTGSTITVTNYGVFGSEAGTPIINHPEAAILGLGAIRPRPQVVDGRIEPRPTVTIALSFDHRIMDGGDADRAMTDLKTILESPFRLGALPR